MLARVQVDLAQELFLQHSRIPGKMILQVRKQPRRLL